jgi:hypothetical protein
MPRKRRNSFKSSTERPKKIKRTSSDSNIYQKQEPYHELSHHEGRIKRFSTAYYVTEFILKNAISFPEDKLKEIFEELIDAAYSKSNSFGKQVRKHIFKKCHHFRFLIFQ